MNSSPRKPHRRGPRRLACCTLLLCLAGVSACPALDRWIEIPAGDLAQALESLSRQLDIQILYDAERLKGLSSSGLRGPLAAREALDRLLEGTTLAARGDGDRFLVAPVPASPPVTAGPAAANPEEPSAPQELNALTVTGTHIRGELPVGAALSLYGRDEADRLGAASVETLARGLLENFSGADSLSSLNTNGNVGHLQQGAAANLFGGAGFDLLGLGPGATLTLLDGHRIAPGGLDGSMVDVSLIPWSLIDHVEVLTDGASALYGSDAVAGVVNLVTRRSLEGAESRLRYGRATEGGAGEFTASQLLGHAWSSGHWVLDYDYADAQGLDAAERRWIAPEGGPYSLIPGNHRHSLFVSGTQALGETTLGVEGLVSRRAFRLSGLQLSTTGFVPNSDIGGGHANLGWVAATVDRPLPAAWRLEGSATHSGMAQWRGADEFPDGLDGARYRSDLEADLGVTTVDASANGPVVALPGGDLRIALGVGYRSDTFRGTVPSVNPLPAVSRNRTDLSAYAEVIAPLIGGDISFPGLRRLSVSWAHRLDYYRHLNAAQNTKWGVSWEPVAGLNLRGTQGTSFQAPLLSQLSAPLTAYTTALPSPTPGGAPTDALVLNAGSPFLVSPTSHAYTLGIDWAPLRWPRLRGSLDYFKVSYLNRIQSQNITAAPLGDQPQLISVTSSNPSLDQVLPIFENPGFQRDGAGLGPAGVTDIIDNSVANQGSTVEQGIRLHGQYTLAGTAAGRWTLRVAGDYLLDDNTSQGPYFANETPVASTLAEPPRFRLRSGVEWQYRQWTADLTLNRTSAYRNTLVELSQPVGAWTTADLAVIATLPGPPDGPWRDLSLVFDVQNLADRRPPRVDIPAGDLATGRAAVPFDGTNASAVGRFVSLELRARWR